MRSGERKRPGGTEAARARKQRAVAAGRGTADKEGGGEAFVQRGCCSGVGDGDVRRYVGTHCSSRLFPPTSNENTYGRLEEGGIDDGREACLRRGRGSCVHRHRAQIPTPRHQCGFALGARESSPARPGAGGQSAAPGSACRKFRAALAAGLFISPARSFLSRLDHGCVHPSSASSSSHSRSVVGRIYHTPYRLVSLDREMHLVWRADHRHFLPMPGARLRKLWTIFH